MSRTALIVLALALLHATLALFFAWVTPWRTPGISNGVYLADIGAPDEIAHANYVGHLLQGRGLPRLDPATTAKTLDYEAHQPPLFYTLDAGMGRLLGVSNIESPSAKMPLRALNAMLGALGVVGLYIFVRSSLESDRLAILAATIGALLPMNVALSGALSNDPLLITLTTFFLVAGIAHRKSPNLRSAVFLGLLVGLTILTKLTGLVLLAIVPFFASRRELFLAWTVALLIGLPWLVRNQTMYGHPLATNAFEAAFPPTVELATLKSPHGFAHWLYVLLAGTLISGLGEFGYMDIQYPGGFSYPLIAVLLVFTINGASFQSLPSRIKRACWALFGLTSLAYVVFNLRYVQPQARYLFPALAPLALACALGVRRFGKSRAPFLATALCIGLLGADLYALSILPREYAVRAARTLGTTKPFEGP